MSEQAPQSQPLDVEQAAARLAALTEAERVMLPVIGESLPADHPEYVNDPLSARAATDYHAMLQTRPTSEKEVPREDAHYEATMGERKLTDIAAAFVESKVHGDVTGSFDTLDALARRLVIDKGMSDKFIENTFGSLNSMLGGLSRTEEGIFNDRVKSARKELKGGPSTPKQAKEQAQKELKKYQEAIKALQAERAPQLAQMKAEWALKEQSHREYDVDKAWDLAHAEQGAHTQTTPEAQAAELTRMRRLLGALGLVGQSNNPNAAPVVPVTTPNAVPPILINGRPVDTGRENPTTDIFTTPIRGEETAQRMSLDDIADRLRGAWELDATSQKTDQDKIDQIKNALQSIGHVPDDTTALEVLNRVKAGPARQEPAQVPRAGRARRAGKWVKGAIVGTVAGNVSGLGAKGTARRIDGTATPSGDSSKRTWRQSVREVASSMRNGTLGAGPTGNTAPAAPLTPEQMAEQQLQASREADEALARLRR